ncbi:hypothetical protein ABFX02_10G059000 [Erythranthe guttata]
MQHGATATTTEHGGAAGFSALHPDIIKSHVLTRLDGPALGSAACCSATLRHISDDGKLWSDICHSTWPSTASSPRLSHLISNFPDGGARAFFSHAFPVVVADGGSVRPPSNPPAELISAVDIFYKGKLIFSKVQETETVTGWFRCSPFRIDLLDPKDVVPTRVKHPEGDGACAEMIDDMVLSWILIDPTGRRRAVNLSSHKPVSVQRHWLSGEVQVRYASILAADQGHVQCGIVVTCAASEGGEMQVGEVSVEMEDMDGNHLTGKDSLVFLHGALEGKKGTGKNRVDEGQRRYCKYMEMKRERRERKLRVESALDMFCVAFGISLFVGFCCFLLCR